MSDPIRLDECGCCTPQEGGAPPAQQVTNPPGLDAIAFRAGDYGTFLRRLLDSLALPPAGGPAPGTRDPDDPANALLDAAAVAGDVLTFYDERLANEAFLRTATERQSVLQLARAIGYEMKPGVAASTHLTFEMAAVDPAAAPMPGAYTPGAALAPDEVELEPGIQVMSVPQGSEPPQTFETVEAIRARPDWNALRPRLTWPQIVLGEDEEYVTSLHFEGTTLNLEPGDVILFAGYQVTDDADPEAPVTLSFTCPSDLEDGVCPDSLTAFARRVHAVAVDEARRTTRVDFSPAPDPPPPPPPKPALTRPLYTLKLDLDSHAVATNVLAHNIAASEMRTFLAVQRWDLNLVQVQARTLRKPPPGPPETGIFVMRARAGFFGNNAPRWESLPDPANLRGGVCGDDATDPFPNNWDTNVPTVWQNSKQVDWSTAGLAGDVYLDRTLPDLTADGWAVFDDAETGGVRFKPYRVSQVGDASLADYAISAKVTRLALHDPDGTAPDKSGDLRFRTATAYLQSEKLPLAEVPIPDPVLAGQPLELDGLDLHLVEGQTVALGGTRVDLPGVTASEILTIAAIEHPQGRTELTLVDGEGNPAPAHDYRRDSVRISANVALATHGETVAEVLGSGDGSRANQSFKLKRPPLTYVSSAAAGGIATTLTVRVNNAAWTELPSLYEAGPHDQVYIVRRDDEGVTSVIFGDGIHGARLPTGTNNVTAVYRTGIGAVGEVGAGTLTMLLAQPLGVRAVTNPLDAGGAAGPETLDDARQAAPAAVKTLDRIVSLRDYEDWARIFAGVGKARTTVIWRKDPPSANRLPTAHAVVHLTVASTSGDPLAGTPVVDNLRAAIDERRDPAARLHVADYDPRPFYVKATLLRDPSYEFEVVHQAALDALGALFSFAARELEQPVSAAEVIACLSAATGVVAVDLDELDYSVADEEDPPAGEQPRPLLVAKPARWHDAGREFRSAQLLYVDLLGVELTEKQ